MWRAGKQARSLADVPMDISDNNIEDTSVQLKHSELGRADSKLRRAYSRTSKRRSRAASSASRVIEDESLYSMAGHPLRPVTNSGSHTPLRRRSPSIGVHNVSHAPSLAGLRPKSSPYSPLRRVKPRSRSIDASFTFMQVLRAYMYHGIR